MKKLIEILALTLALNFLIVAGGVGWLFKSGKLDKAKAKAIKELVFAPPVAPAPPAAAAPPGPATLPADRLDALLEKYAHPRAGDQVELIQQASDARSAELERKRREVEDLQRQVAEQQERLAGVAAGLEAQRTAFAAQEQKSQATTTEKGFQDSLKLYSAMPAKQAKQVFMTLPDDIVVDYLRAMPSRSATKIVKEFKTPDETVRMNRLMERMRQGPRGDGSGPPLDKTPPASLPPPMEAPAREKELPKAP